MQGFVESAIVVAVLAVNAVLAADPEWKPYSPPCVEREDVFAFASPPAVRKTGQDRYEIRFASQGRCDATVGIVDGAGKVVRHLASGVLGANAPTPFVRNRLDQTLVWDGKDDLGEYVREPERLRVRVTLGLKPEFDRLLGSTDPRNIPGVVLGVAVTEQAAYVLSRGVGSALSHAHLRKFDRDGNYLASLVPPPADLPWERLKGMGWVEFEPGRRALQAPSVWSSVSFDGAKCLPGAGGHSLVDCQPVVIGSRFFYSNGGGVGFFGASGDPSTLHYVYTDGATDIPGLVGRPLYWVPRVCHTTPRLAASPDGRYVYWVGLKSSGSTHAPVVLRCPTAGDAPAEVFAGRMTGSRDNPRFEVGSGNDAFNNPLGLDCDAQGRVYVTDNLNSRVQVFAPDGRYLKTIPCDRPMLIRVHQRSGALYVLHFGDNRGRTVPRLTKFASFERPVEEYHIDDFPRGQMAVDSWSPRPRLWVGGSVRESLYATTMTALYQVPGENVTLWEEDGNTLRKIVDFDAEARRADGDDHSGRWGSDDKGGIADRVACDPTREQVYLRYFRSDALVYDLPTGRRLRSLDGKGPATVRFPSSIDDMSFDRRGYLHAHLEPTRPGVGRLDPNRKSPYVDYLGNRHPNRIVFAEVPYDYGEELFHQQNRTLRLWLGGILTKDQPGGKYFSDGLGVNPRGDIAENANIYFIPNRDDETMAATMATTVFLRGADAGIAKLYAAYKRDIEDREKLGEQIYSIRPGPGRPLSGATIWTYAANGELRQEAAAVAPGVVAGVALDNDGALYFTSGTVRMRGGRRFLDGRGGTVGAEKPLVFDRGLPPNDQPHTGTFLKTRGRGVAFLLENARVPLTEKPDRPPDVYCAIGGGDSAWVEGAEWLYAGASPVTMGTTCGCPTLRAHLDWYQRSFVPESYRHSIAVLDTAGNLVLHIGRYGNLDSGNGVRSRIPVGGDNIALFIPRFVSGTDNYLVFDDWGERIAVLKLNYHAEAVAAIGAE